MYVKQVDDNETHDCNDKLCYKRYRCNKIILHTQGNNLWWAGINEVFS